MGGLFLRWRASFLSGEGAPLEASVLTRGVEKNRRMGSGRPPHAPPLCEILITQEGGLQTMIQSSRSRGDN